MMGQRTAQLLVIALALPGVSGLSHAECEQMLGLDEPPIADLLLARPVIEDLRFAPIAQDGSCRVGAELTIAIPARAEVDWADIVITHQHKKGATLEADYCAMVVDGRAKQRLRLIPGQRYTATLAVYDVEGRKSEAVALDLVGPGLASREWLAKAPYCPLPAADPMEDHQLPHAVAREPWSRAILGAFGAVGFTWLMVWLLGGLRRRSRD